ncbi:MAG: hypothetical protein CUN55_21425, partial [Phototrophicales bacterium]
FTLLTVVVSIVYLTIQSATAGARLNELEKERAMLEREIQEMSIDLASATSLTSIGEMAEEKGFVTDAEVYYVGELEAFADSQASNF